MHTHQSIWKGDKPLFAGDGYGGMSEIAMHYIGGILKHAPALAAFTNPTTNSYHRLVPGFEAPVNLAYSQPQPLGGGPHPDVLAVAEGEAHRGPLPRSDVQRLPGLRGHADGRPRRHREAARPGRAARQGHLRAHARGAEGRPDHAGLARRGARAPARRTTSSCSRATSSPRTSSRPGSSTRRRTRSTRCGCGRIRTSSSCTTTPDRTGVSPPGWDGDHGVVATAERALAAPPPLPSVEVRGLAVA